MSWSRIYALVIVCQLVVVLLLVLLQEAYT
jgi:hypothetical protein